MSDSFLLENLKRMANLGGFYMISSVLEKSLAFILIPIYTTYLTPADYGIIGMLTIVTAWVQKFAVTPVGNGITRMYHAPENKDKQGELVFSAWLFVFLQMLVISALYALFYKQITIILFANPSLYNLTFLFTYILLLKPFADLMNSLLRIKGKANIIAIINILRFVSVGSLQVYLLVWRGLGVKAMVFGLILGQLVTIIAVFPIIFKELRFKFVFSSLKPVLHFGYPLILAAISSTTLGFIDKYLLRINWDISLVGKYIFAIQMASIITILFNEPMKQAFLPVVFKMENNKEQQINFVKRSCTYITMIGLLIWLVLSAFIDELLFVLVRNPEFKTVWNLVPVLGFLNIQSGLASYFGNGIGMARKSFIISIISISRLVLTGLLLFIFIPLYGIFGAACSILIGQIISNIFSAKLSNYYYGLNFETVRIFTSSLIAIILYAFIFFIISLGFDMILTIIIKIGIISLFPIILYLSGIIKDSEKRILLESIQL